MPKNKKFTPLPLFKVESTPDTGWLRIEFNAATNNSFEIKIPNNKGAFEELIFDICKYLPFLMRLDGDLMEAMDDAGRTQVRSIDVKLCRQFAQKYDFKNVESALPGFDTLF